jgi:dienelactone hydrolase
MLFSKPNLSRLVFALFLTIFAISFAEAQTCPASQRYRKQVFPRVNVTRDIVYERADKYDALNINWLEDIKLDFYEPANDGLQKRPLVLFFFGGAFQIGDKSDADVKAWCDSLARHGYCAAAVNYRLGFNVASTASTIRAVYRAVQDSRAAIRFFKEKHALYKIDTTQIFVGGESAGAITALHTAYMNTNIKAPSEIRGTLTEWQNLGCLDCTGDYRRHTVDPKGIISLWGAVYSLSYIESSINVPTLMIHGTADWIVPYNEGRPFTGDFPSTFPWVYGSVKMDARFAATNIYREFYPYQGEGHVFYGLPTGIVTFPNRHWNPVWNQGKNFLLKVMGFNTPQPTGNLQAAFGSTQSYNIPSTRVGSTFCWTVTGGTVLSYSNGGKTASIRWNTSGTRRISVTETDYKQLAGSQVTVNIGSVARLGADDATTPQGNETLSLFPNPLSENSAFYANLHSKENGIALCRLTDLTGKTVAEFKQNISEGDNTFLCPTDNLAKGVYVFTVQYGSTNLVSKLLVQ